MTELKPCPFCGKTNLFVGTEEEIELQDEEDENYRVNSHTYCVCCDMHKGGCGASSGFRFTVDEAIEAWNRRADDATC